jgi:hypothetical protein
MSVDARGELHSVMGGTVCVRASVVTLWERWERWEGESVLSRFLVWREPLTRMSLVCDSCESRRLEVNCIRKNIEK